MRRGVAALLLALVAPLSSAIELDLQSPESIKSAASTAAWGMMTYYSGNETGQIPGELPQPYYWWECGAMFGTLIDYWVYTGDDTYNDLVTQGLLFQVGEYNAFMPTNQSRDEGNDDQVFWGFAAMTAAEFNFPNPPPDQPQWLSLAQGVFNSQANRWDNATNVGRCNGGLRWQIFQFNQGYGYKNAPSNAGFLNLGARLYAYTGNSTYADWVTASWGWMEGVGMISPTGSVFDGTNVGNNCTTLDHERWTYSYGMVINAAAYMWNVTGDDMWKQRMLNTWHAASLFFPSGDIMVEIQCELVDKCDTDELSFKAYFSRFLVSSAKIAPFFWDTVQPYIAASAIAAAAQCDGTGQDGNTQACGFQWPKKSTWDGTTGLGQQMSALAVIQANLIQSAPFPVSAKHGGTSKGDPSAGSNTVGAGATDIPLTPITTSDRAGAGLLTALVLAIMLGGAWWLCQ